MYVQGSEISVFIAYACTSDYNVIIDEFFTIQYICTGQPPMGALLSGRNSINYTTESNMLQLIKRDMNIFCSRN